MRRVYGHGCFAPVVLCKGAMVSLLMTSRCIDVTNLSPGLVARFVAVLLARLPGFRRFGGAPRLPVSGLCADRRALNVLQSHAATSQVALSARTCALWHQTELQAFLSYRLVEHFARLMFWWFRVDGGVVGVAWVSKAELHPSTRKPLAVLCSSVLFHVSPGVFRTAQRFYISDLQVSQSHGTEVHNCKARIGCVWCLAQHSRLEVRCVVSTRILLRRCKCRVFSTFRSAALACHK